MRARRWLALHGFAGGPRSWSKVAAHLPASELYCPPIAGHGRRPAMPVTSSGSFDNEVARLERLVRGGGAAEPLLAGYSLGGRLALGLLASARIRFAGAVLVGCHPGLRSAAERAARRAADERWATLIETEGLAEFERRWSALPLFASQNAAPAAALAAQRETRLGHRPQALAAAMRALSLGVMPSRWPDLPRIRRQVWLVVGELDRKFRTLAEEMASLLPSATLVVVPGCGHNPLLEAPRELAGILRNVERLVGDPAAENRREASG